MRDLFLRLLCMAFAIGSVVAGDVRATEVPTGIAAGTRVRVQEPALGPGWHEGKVGFDGNGCTMVTLIKPSGPYTSVLLQASRPTQVLRSGQWVALSVRGLVEKMPSRCRAEAND